MGPNLFAREEGAVLQVALAPREGAALVLAWPTMARLLANLELLARGDLRALKRICQVDDDDLRDMVAEVRGYDPKPGCRFSADGTATVTPDLFVRRTADGWAVELNRSTLPRLLVDRRAHARLASGSKPAQAFAAQAMSGANWLRQALDSRAQTILKVGAELVAQQRGFFERGVSGLKPLTLARIADAVGVHETTVSRVATVVLSSPRARVADCPAAARSAR